MKGMTSWNSTPYCQFDKQNELNNPTIVRLAPLKDGFELEWLAPENSGQYTLSVKEREGDFSKEYSLNSSQIKINELCEKTEYILKITDENGRQSRQRLIYTTDVPGTVINYLHPGDHTYAFSGRYLCSPSLVVLPSGRYIVSMDVFNRGTPQNHTIMFKSDDCGETWQYLTEIHPCFWGKLFLHKGELYLLGISGQFGNILIGKSTDEGNTWTKPVTLFYGSCLEGEGFHRAPCIITEHNGRLWTSMEYGNRKFNGFCNCVLSADIEGDLLSPENWILSEPYRHENNSLAIEGNVVVNPSGELINFLRYKFEEAILLDVNTQNPHAINTLRKNIFFPMASTKFEIKRHSNGKYYALGNDCKYERTKLSIYSSDDLENWTFETAVLDWSFADYTKIGFQYPVFEFEDNGFLVISRTAFGRAACYHDSNMITCHRVPFKF